jgi:ATP-dependent protease Clp ATPase subunit
MAWAAEVERLHINERVSVARARVEWVLGATSALERHADRQAGAARGAQGARTLRQIIGGPSPFFICDGCVGSHSETVAREEARLAALPDDCSFCGKTRRQVRVLVDGEKATICDESLGLCRDILKEEQKRFGAHEGEA